MDVTACQVQSSRSEAERAAGSVTGGQRHRPAEFAGAAERTHPCCHGEQKPPHARLRSRQGRGLRRGSSCRGADPSYPGPTRERHRLAPCRERVSPQPWTEGAPRACRPCSWVTGTAKLDGAAPAHGSEEEGSDQNQPEQREWINLTHGLTFLTPGRSLASPDSSPQAGGTPWTPETRLGQSKKPSERAAARGATWGHGKGMAGAAPLRHQCWGRGAARQTRRLLRTGTCSAERRIPVTGALWSHQSAAPPRGRCPYLGT